MYAAFTIQAFDRAPWLQHQTRNLGDILASPYILPTTSTQISKFHRSRQWWPAGGLWGLRPSSALFLPPPPFDRIRTPKSADRIGTTYSIRFVNWNLTRIRVLSFQLSFAFFLLCLLKILRQYLFLLMFLLIMPVSEGDFLGFSADPQHSELLPVEVV